MIIQGVVTSYFVELFQGVHSQTDEYRMALYTPGANFTRETQAYTTVGEVAASGYQAGGQPLTGFTVGVLPADPKDPDTRPWATLDWNDPSWPFSSISARAGLIYNLTKQNRAVVVVDFGKVFTSTNGSFSVIRPDHHPPLIQIR
jgi:hypothetical protein